MKNIIASILISLSFVFPQDINGTYELYGLYIIHQSFARWNTSVVVNHPELDFNLVIDEVEQGEIFNTTYQGPYGHLYAQALNLFLNITLNDDGSGTISEGSYYPTETVENCMADIAILPIVDELIYSSDLNSDLTLPHSNILGFQPDEFHEPLPFPGQPAGSFSLSQSSVFDYFPSNPTNVTIPFPVQIDLNNNGIIEENLNEYFPANSILPGQTSGYIKRCNVPTIAPLENENSDLYLEWHAIDGEFSQSGLGDIIGEDEDIEDYDGDGNPGDGSDYDGVWALETLNATNLNPGCGYNAPVAGNLLAYSDTLSLGSCIDYENIYTESNSVYIVDPSLSDWGYFLTYNASQNILEDDSDHDFNGVDGRLIMNFDPTCIPHINVRHIMIEFKQVGENVCDELKIEENINSRENHLISSIYPNPFNPVLNYTIDVTEPTNINIEVYDINGNLINILARDHYVINSDQFIWDANEYPSGVYLIKTSTKNSFNIQKTVLLK